MKSIFVKFLFLNAGDIFPYYLVLLFLLFSVVPNAIHSCKIPIFVSRYAVPCMENCLRIVRDVQYQMDDMRQMSKRNVLLSK